MKITQVQLDFIDNCRKRGEVTLTGEQLAAALLRVVALGSSSLEADKEKARALCRKLAKRGMKRGAVRSQIMLREYARRIAQADPAALEEILSTVSD